MRIANAFNPSSPEYKFQYLFLSVIENPAQRVKPPQVDETRWRQALAQAGGPDNPSRCGNKHSAVRHAVYRVDIHMAEAGVHYACYRGTGQQAMH